MDVLWEALGLSLRKVRAMKTSLATSISIIGVLAAGGVALAVNTSVLDSATMTAENAPALEAEALPLSSSGDAQPGLSNEPVATKAADFDSPTTTIVQLDPTATTLPPSSSPTTTLQGLAKTRVAYSVQGFGIVTLEQSTDSLKIVSVTPESGIKYVTKQESPTRIEALFTMTSGSGIKFHADVINGRIVTSVMNDHKPRALGGQKREDHDDHHKEDHAEEHESDEHDDD